MKIVTFGKLLLWIGILSSTLYARDYSVREDSKIGFAVGKFLVLNVEGRFQKFSGTLTLDSQNQITALKGEVAIDSITTENAKRDAHLLAPDFLDAQNFPTARLSLVSYIAHKSEDLGKIAGKLTALLELHGKSLSTSSLIASLRPKRTTPNSRFAASSTSKTLESRAR